MDELGSLSKNKGRVWPYLIFGLIFLICIFVVYHFFFSAPLTSAGDENFIVSLTTSRGEALGKLEREGFVRSATVLRLVLGIDTISPGGYKLSRSMNVFEVTRVLKSEPHMKWVVIREGLRKEEIAELLAKTLGWSDEKKDEWLLVTKRDLNYEEGVYFPDTYLIPRDEEVSDVAMRMRRRFEEKFRPLSLEAAKQNIRWPTVIKLASLIQREAAGKQDMALISGVLWNRLHQGMKLDIDATLQYIKGNEEDGWWGKVRPEDKLIDSPYNTYKYKGLPPGPISNPGIDAIEAVVFPEETDCIYYLHDANRDIHCARTYTEHKRNIEIYLN